MARPSGGGGCGGCGCGCPTRVWWAAGAPSAGAPSPPERERPDFWRADSSPRIIAAALERAGPCGTRVRIRSTRPAGARIVRRERSVGGEQQGSSKGAAREQQGSSKGAKEQRERKEAGEARSSMGVSEQGSKQVGPTSAPGMSSVVPTRKLRLSSASVGATSAFLLTLK